jgi:hypothetical protein
MKEREKPEKEGIFFGCYFFTFFDEKREWVFSFSLKNVIGSPGNYTSEWLEIRNGRGLEAVME